MIRPPIEELAGLVAAADRLPRPLCRDDVAIAGDLHGDSELLVVGAVNALPALLAYVRQLESLAEARGRAVDAAAKMRQYMPVGAGTVRSPHLTYSPECEAAWAFDAALAAIPASAQGRET